MSTSLSLNRKPRVLILSASSGAGHVRAAQALEKAFRAQGNCEVEHIDALEHVTNSSSASMTKPTSAWCAARRT